MRIENTGKSSVVLHIDTTDCEYKGNGLYELTLIDSLLVNKGYHLLVSLASAEIPFSFYCVNSYNNKLVYTENMISKQIIIPPGNYSAKSLANQISNQLGSANYTITYNPIDAHYTISTTNEDLETIFDFNASTCDILLGFDEAGEYILTHLTPVESNFFVNLNYTNCLYLLTDLTDRGSIDSRTKSTSLILQKIPINSPPGNMLYFYNVQASHKILFHTNQVQKIQFGLFDDHRRPVELNGQKYQISVLFDFVDEVQEKYDETQLGGEMNVNIE